MCIYGLRTSTFQTTSTPLFATAYGPEQWTHLSLSEETFSEHEEAARYETEKDNKEEGRHGR
jgi:hypothetical protein